MKSKFLNLFFFSLLTMGYTFAETATPEKKVTEEKVLLSYNLKEGQKYYITTKMDMDVSQTLPGQAVQNIQSSVEIGNKIDVKKVDKDGVASATVTFDHIVFESTTPAGKVTFDSNKQNENLNPALLPFKALKGLSYEMNLSTSGKIKSLNGVDKIIDSILASLSDLDPKLKPVISAQISKQFSEKALTESFEKTSAIYPDHKVALGDTWDVTIELSNPYSMKSKNIYTLNKNLENTFEIGIEGSLKSMDNNIQQMGQIAFKQELSGSSKGSYIINKESGWIESGTINQDVSGKLVNIPNEQMKNEMTIPFSMKIKTTINTKKI